eukprot:421278_1
MSDCSCLCIKCIVPRPKYGDNIVEKFLTLITVILFIFSFVEFKALVDYQNAFKDEDSESCCGVIEFNDGRSIGKGGVCKVDNFPVAWPKIPSVEINGSVFCMVNGTICDEWEYTTKDDKVVDSTLDECLTEGGYNVYDICNGDLLTPDEIVWTPYKAATTLLWLLLITCLWSLFDFCGCCSCVKCNHAKNDYNCGIYTIGIVDFCNFLCTFVQVVVWIGILLFQKFLIEDVVSNEFSVSSLNNDAYDYLKESNCGQELYFVIWTDYNDLDIPEWLMSNEYELFVYCGLVFTILGFIVAFGLKYKACKRANSRWEICCQWYRGEINKEEMRRQFKIQHQEVETTEMGTHE